MGQIHTALMSRSLPGVARSVHECESPGVGRYASDCCFCGFGKRVILGEDLKKPAWNISEHRNGHQATYRKIRVVNILEVDADRVLTRVLIVNIDDPM